MMQRFVKLDLTNAKRVFVVGDIHGAYSKLEVALKEINFNFRNGDYLISVGDLVDRGPENERVLEFLATPWFHAVRGNHEQMIINQEEWGLSAMNGGMWFNRLDDYMKMVFQKSFAELPFAMEVLVPSGRRIGICHAFYPRSDWNDIQQVIDDDYDCERLLWDRKGLKYIKLLGDDASNIANIDHVYYGHTPMREPFHSGNQSWIDTGAYADEGKFTIVEIT